MSQIKKISNLVLFCFTLFTPHLSSQWKQPAFLPLYPYNNVCQVQCSWLAQNHPANFHSRARLWTCFSKILAPQSWLLYHTSYQCRESHKMEFCSQCYTALFGIYSCTFQDGKSSTHEIPSSMIRSNKSSSRQNPGPAESDAVLQSLQNRIMLPGLQLRQRNIHLYLASPSPPPTIHCIVYQLLQIQFA